MMSFFDYVHDMTHKYRLAIALAVVKGKPAELSVEQYIQKLKIKYNGTEMEMDDDEINMTICSDDFDMQDEDLQVTKDSFDDQQVAAKGNTQRPAISNDFDAVGGKIGSRDDSNKDAFQTLKNIDENVLNEKDDNTFVPTQSTQITFCEDSQIFEINTLQNIHERNNIISAELIKDCLQNTKRFDETEKSAVANEGLENTDNNDNQACDRNLYDSQATQIYTLQMQSQNYTHISQSQLEVIHIPRKHLYANYGKGHENENGIESNERIDENMENNVTNNENIEHNVTKTDNSQEQNDGHVSNAVKISDGVKYVRDIEKLQAQDIDMDATYVESTEINNTIAVSYLNDVHTVHNVQTLGTNSKNEKSLEGKSENETVLERNSKKDNAEQLIQKLNETLAVSNVESSQIKYIIDRDGKMYRILHVENNFVYDQQIGESQNTEFNNPENQLDISKHVNNSQEFNTQTQEFNTQTQKFNTQTQEINDIYSKVIRETKYSTPDPKNTCDVTTVRETNARAINAKDTCQNVQDVAIENISQKPDDETSSEFEDDVEEFQTEVVSFKVIGELNRVKIFLSRNVDRKNVDSLTDSGYKSDSQKSVRNVQTPSNWLNQSAHCLYRHLVDCQLTSSTHEITQEISQVLANLVDRLHDDENYPPFLVDMLGTIEKTIADICHGDSYGKDVLLKKDEQVQRLCLLNKSVHILKYTIEKLTDKLDNVYSHLCGNEKLYEITDIVVCENICYMFHTLEICLQRYIRAKSQDTGKQVQSQNNTQNSQDEKEKLLKKSSISDIWRRKWIQNYKKDVSSDICLQTQCVLKKCGEVLNKMIVGCMEGYSLVAFAALQCFNLMQNQ